jgi:ssDNA-specific exonuclease RecJ
MYTYVKLWEKTEIEKFQFDASSILNVFKHMYQVLSHFKAFEVAAKLAHVSGKSTLSQTTCNLDVLSQFSH